MSIIRSPKVEKFFYTLDKRISEDRRLSWQARGLLIYLLGKPDHWKVSVEALKAETINTRKPTSRDGIYSILDELTSSGYVVRQPSRDEYGRMAGFDYMVNETPLTDFPLTVKPLTAETTLVSTDIKQEMNEANLRHPQAEDIPYEAILEKYNEVCGKTFKGAIALTPKRKANIKTLFNLKIKNKRPFKEHGMAFWEAYFNDCLENSHWRGQNDRGWKADLEFLTRPEVATKLLEGTLS